MRLVASADHVARQQRQLTWKPEMTPRRSARCRSNKSICAKTDGKQEDPFLFRPPVCPPAACFFFLSSHPRLDISNLSHHHPLHSSSLFPIPPNKKQYLPPFPLPLSYTAPGRASSSTNPPNGPVSLFPDKYSSRSVTSLHLLKTSLFFRHHPASISRQGPLFQSGFPI